MHGLEKIELYIRKKKLHIHVNLVSNLGGCMVWKKLILTVSTLGLCGGFKRTVF